MAAVGGFVVVPLFRQILLLDEAAGVVVAVLILFAVAELLGAAVVRVAQVDRNGQRPALPHIFPRGADGERGRVRLRSAGNVGDGLGQRQLRLRQADEFGGLQRR